MENMNKEPEIGVFWIGRADYPEFVSICIDKALLPPDYDAWLAFMDAFVEQRRAQGYVPVLVNVRLREFVDWCRVRKYPTNGSARQAYAAIKLHQHK